MRLTLRTLLAWLDDKLPASDVKQIGKQVSESPFAQEVIDRTYRVMRQRRLLVPPTTGPDATDPNTVAAYLSDELAPDDVVEFEKKCLTSDVHLAEVASAHQILSLIGHKAKVPPEARHRMYRLIKGRESVKRVSAQPVFSEATHETPKRETVPPVEWTAPIVPGRPINERLGIGALVAALLAVIGWTAYTSLSPDTSREDVLAANRSQVIQATLPKPPGADTAEANAAAQPIAPTTVAKTETKAPEPVKPEAETKTAAAPKPGAMSVAAGDGVIYGWNAGKSAWNRLVDADPIKDGARLLNLDPFWTNVTAGPVQASLIGGAKLTIGTSQPFTVTLDDGRALLKGADVDHPYTVKVGNSRVTIAPGPGVLVGIERAWSLAPGSTEATAAPLVVYVSSGEATIDSGGNKEVVKGPASASVTSGGAIRVAGNPKLPGWVGDTGASPAEKQLAARFAKFFRPGGAILRDLVEAVDSDDQDIRLLAIRGLGAIGDAEMIVPVLNNASTDAATRAAAADVLRSLLARGGDSSKGVRTELTNVFGQEWADDVEKLLVGFTAEETLLETTGAELVRLLTSPELGTRELAITALKAITHRDALEYDPLKPEGKGLKAWQDLLHKKELIKGLPPAPVLPRK